MENLTLDNEVSLKLLATLLNNSTEGVVVSDETNHIIFVNSAFSAITGYTPEDVLGKPGSLLRSERYDDQFYKNLWQKVHTEHQWEGEFWVRRKNGEVFLEWLSFNAITNQDGKITHYVTIFSDITALKTSTERIQFLSYHDPLTNLPNRASLQDQIEIILQNEHGHKIKFALVALDIDHFEKVNSSFGMLTGDHLLQAIAVRVKSELSEDEILTRHDSDEFIILIPNVENETQLVFLCEKLLHAMQQPFEIDDKQLYCTTSIGIAIFPEDGQTADTLIKNVNTALTRAKELGRNNRQFYKHDMNDHAKEHVTLGNKLHSALKDNEFELFYQPQVSLDSGKITGVEALIRWQNKELGYVSPGKFIPIAENTGLIIPLSEWIIKTACNNHVDWLAKGLPPITVSINISSLHFHQKEFKTKLLQFLKESRINPKHLKLELTEGIVMQDAEEIIKTLHALKALGLNLSIDDFGTGYSSLSYLKKFPIDQLKIDQSFVRNLVTDGDDKQIIRAILSLAKSLKLSVVAEGVETKEQLNFLRDEGCDIIQGYYFSKPLSNQDLIKLLQENKVWTI